MPIRMQLMIGVSASPEGNIVLGALNINSLSALSDPACYADYYRLTSPEYGSFTLSCSATWSYITVYDESLMEIIYSGDGINAPSLETSIYPDAPFIVEVSSYDSGVTGSYRLETTLGTFLKLDEIPYPPLSIDNESFDIAYISIDIVYGYQLYATGGYGDFTWTSEGLPIGMSMDVTGLITTVNNENLIEGIYPVTITVSDNYGHTDTKIMNLECKLLPQYVEFNFTGDVQTWTPPEGVEFVNLKIWGAGGQDGVSGYGGWGGLTEILNFPVESLNIYVGESTGLNRRPYGGGGIGIGTNHSNGGGRSYIEKQSDLEIIGISGGGGGGGASGGGEFNGGWGGGIEGTYGMYGVGGGTQTSPGSEYNEQYPNGENNGIGPLGGNGNGGGGGGGYFGGQGAWFGYGGGGGSGYIDPTLEGYTETSPDGDLFHGNAGKNNQHGKVVIYWDAVP